MMKTFFNTLCLLFCCWGIATAQFAEPGIASAVFTPGTVDVGKTSALNIVFSNSGSSSIPANSVELTISTPNTFYYSTGASTPTGVGADLFEWTYFGAPNNIWRGRNKVSIDAFGGGGAIAVDVTGIAASAGFENSIVNVNIVSNFGSFKNQTDNDNVTVPLKITQGIIIPCIDLGGIGAACDDKNDCTENDKIDANCDCVGTPITTKPVLAGVPTNVTVQCDAIPAKLVLTANGIDITPTDSRTGDDDCDYKLTRSWTVTDACGNDTTYTQMIFITDEEAPVLQNVPANITINVNNGDTIPATPDVTAVDNCDPNPIVHLATSDIITNPCSNIATFTRSWSTSDKCSNISTSKIQEITIINDGFIIDSDNDGTCDPQDACPNDPNKIEVGACGCGEADVDSDNDTVLDCDDKCPGHDDRIDSDNDGIPDGCEECDGSLTITLTESYDVSCAGGNDGKLVINVTGGTGPYTISWANGVSTLFNDGLSSGVYKVDVTDVNNCKTSKAFTIGEPTPIVVNAQITPQGCSAGTGAIDITVSGGIAPYTYEWLFNGNTEDLTGLDKGEYNLYVTDANNCKTDKLAFIVGEDCGCNQLTDGGKIGFGTPCTDEVEICVNEAIPQIGNCELPSGGSGDIEYIWLVSQTCPDRLPTNINNDPDWTPIANSNSPTYQPTSLYDVTCFVRCSRRIGCDDFDGESNIVKIIVNKDYKIWYADVDKDGFGDSNDSVKSCSQPSGYVPNNTDCNDNDSTVGAKQAQGTACDDGDATTENDKIQADGCTCEGTPIVDPCTALGGDHDKDGICADNDCDDTNANIGAKQIPGTTCDDGDATTENDVILADGCTCQGTKPNCDLQVEILNQTNPSCSGREDGIIAVNASNGTAPYSYKWNTGSEQKGLASATAGTYTVSITDANDCEVVKTYTLVDPDPLVIESTVVDATCGKPNGIISINVRGGDGNYQYIWNNSATTEDLTNLPAGSYTLIVRDGNYCSNTVTREVKNITGPDCNNGGKVVECDKATITYGNGQIQISVGDGGDYRYVIHQTPFWGVVAECKYDCGDAWSVDLPDGGYAVRVYEKGEWRTPFCETRIKLDGGTSCTDYDKDGFCADDDCNDNDATVGGKQAPGTSCDDGDITTENDVIQSDGCTCQGTTIITGNPNVCEVTVTKLDDGFTLSGMDEPYTKITVYKGIFSALIYSCNYFDDCPETKTFSDLEKGTYTVKVESYNKVNGRWVRVCNYLEYIKVNDGTGCTDYDQDGICAEEDCNDNDRTIGRKQVPGTSCDDGDVTTENDIIQSDGCTCLGQSIVEPCQLFTDKDSDGICADEDCDDNNASIGRKQTPGTACDDSDENTGNDMIQSDGCTCKGTPKNTGDPNCDNVTAVGSNGNIIVNGLTSPVEHVKLYRIGANNSQTLVDECTGDCGDYWTFTNLSAGDYLVLYTLRNRDWVSICTNGAQDLKLYVTLPSNSLTSGATDRDNGVQNDSRLEVLPGTLKVYPNPAQSEAWIDLSDWTNESIDLTIYNHLSQLVLQKHIEKVPTEPERINLRSFTNGLYYVQVKAKGQQTITKKLIVSRLY